MSRSFHVDRNRKVREKTKELRAASVLNPYFVRGAVCPTEFELKEELDTLIRETDYRYHNHSAQKRGRLTKDKVTNRRHSKHSENQKVQKNILQDLDSELES